MMVDISNDIRIFPNPATCILNIVSDSNVEINRGVIYNPMGQNVKDLKVQNDSIDISSLSSGIYSLELILKTDLQ